MRRPTRTGCSCLAALRDQQGFRRRLKSSASSSQPPGARWCSHNTTTTRRNHDHRRRPAPRLAAPAAFAELDALTIGTVAVPGDEAYDALVSPWNLADPGPARRRAGRTTAQDVVEAVRFAARHGLRVTPQATGHGPMADLTTELLVTTKGLDEVVVHPEGWARVGAGVKWLQVVEAAAPYGLAPLSGSITDVGIVGYTTGGGLGPMARTYGLAIDKVRAIEVVTGDGVLRRATPTEHPELFFGLRGGKGMLGIVTAIEFDLVHQPTFYGGSLWFDGGRRGDRHRAVAALVRGPARGGHHVDRAVPAARHAGRAAEARRPAHAVGALRVDRRRRGGRAPVRRDPARPLPSSSTTWPTSPTPRSTRCTPTRSTRPRPSRRARAHRLPRRGRGRACSR